MQNSKSERRAAKRKSLGKRKLSDQEDCDEPPAQQRIPDLFARGGSSNNNNSTIRSRDQKLSPSAKRLRSASPPHLPVQRSNLHPSEKMYNFPNAGQQASSAPTSTSQSGSDPRTAALRARAYNASPRPSNFTPHTGAKRIVVKNLRAVPRLNQDAYFEKIWGQLDAALTAIFNDTKPEHSLEELYKGAENVCRQGRAPALSKKLEGKTKDHMSGALRKALLEKSGDGDDVDMLRAVAEAWSTWNTRLVTIRSIFYYLDQSFLLHSKDNPIIYEMGIAQFRACVFSDRTLKPKILQGASNLIDIDRKDDKKFFDSTLLRQTIRLFHDLGVYRNAFEPRFIEDSDAYLKYWTKKESSRNDLATYIDMIHRLIETEMSRCNLFGLDRGTKQRLSDLLDHSLVKEQESVLLYKEDVLGLFRSNDRKSIEMLYALLQRVNFGTKMRPAFDAYIIEEGSDIVFDEARETEMVVRLLDHKKNLDDIWKGCFHNNETLGHALRESFESFINNRKRSQANWGTDNPKPGEMIAKHVDLLLKGGLKTTAGRAAQVDADDSALVDEDAEINRQLDQVLDLFRFVHGKAVFEAFYKNDLARRLLMGRSASDEAEKSMLARLKSECGSSFTHNLESMFKDMDLARDEMTAYNSRLREQRNRPTIDFNAHVLSASAWPSYPDVEVIIPPVISRAINSFEQFYHTKYSGRRLQWKHSLAHCQLKARFPRGDKEIIVSSFQAIVLLLFNDVPGDETLSYSQIKEITTLTDPELKRTLQSLACAKYRVLSKQPKGREVNNSDMFKYNSKFEDRKMRIKINQIQLKETKEENKDMHERVVADRHNETQAAIVRIMKSRMTIKHPDLVAEVIKATRDRGVLDLADIKKNIERLIEKDYIERVRDKANEYRYLA